MAETVEPSAPSAAFSSVPRLVLAWLWVGIPLLWGVSETVKKALALFR